MERNGDCFEVAAVAVALNRNLGPEARVCHGYVTHPELRIRHVHAWVEVEQVFENPAWPRPMVVRMCVDKSNGHDMTLPADLYYDAGEIRHVLRYDAHEAAVQMVKTGQYGPWEQERLDRQEEGP